MPEIAIKQTLSDASFRRGIAESAVSIRNWGKEAQKVFNETQTPMERYGQELARLTKLHKDGYIAAEAYGRAVEQAAAKGAKTIDYRGGVYGGPGAKAAGPGVNLQGLAEGVGGGIGGSAGSLLAGALFSPTTAIVAAAAAAAAGIREIALEMRQADLTAQNLGVSLHVFEQMEISARMAGLSVEQMTTAMFRMEKGLGEAAVGEGKGGKALAQLGLDPTAMMAKNPDEAFVILAKAVSEVENRFERARLEVQLFGRAGMEMDLMLRKAAEGFGGVDTPIAGTAEAAARAGDKIFRCGRELKNFAVSAVGGLELLIEKEHELLGWGPQAPPVLVGLSENAKRIQVEMEANAEKARQSQEIVDKLHSEYANLSSPERDLATIARQSGFESQQYQDAKRIVDAMERQSETKKTEAAETARLKTEEAACAAIDKQWMEQRMDQFGKMRYQATEKIKDTDRLAEAIGKINAMEKAAADIQREQAVSTFEKSMRFELGAKPGETSREAQLRKLAESGISETEAARLGNEAAEVDARDAGRKARGSLAANAAYGSREAFDLVAKAQEAGKATSDSANLARMKEHLQRIKEILDNIYHKPAPVAPIP